MKQLPFRLDKQPYTYAPNCASGDNSSHFYSPLIVGFLWTKNHFSTKIIDETLVK